MNPSSFELSLKPSKLYSPGFWTNLVNNFSKIHDLNERLTLIRNLKLELEQEAAWLVASQPVSFPVSMAFVNNGEFFSFRYQTRSDNGRVFISLKSPNPIFNCKERCFTRLNKSYFLIIFFSLQR